MLKNNHPNYFYTKDGVRLFYQTNFTPETFDPKKPVLVFIYGLLCSNHHFKYQIPFFEDLGFQILLHDYRFHFASTYDGPLDDFTFENVSNDLHQLMMDLKIKKGILIGHSMGVNICLEHARRHPKDVSSLVLISGSVVPPQDVMFDSKIVDLTMPYIETVTNYFPELYKSIWKNSYKNPIAQYAIFDGGFNKKKTDMEFVQIYMKRISELPERLFFHLLKQMHDHDIADHLDHVNTPTLIIGGDKDKIIPNYLQFQLSEKIKNSKTYIVKDGSHVPQVDFPELINERVLLFLKKNFKTL